MEEKEIQTLSNYDDKPVTKMIKLKISQAISSLKFKSIISPKSTYDHLLTQEFQFNGLHYLRSSKEKQLHELTNELENLSQNIEELRASKDIIGTL
jgi:hypothetical protein